MAPWQIGIMGMISGKGKDQNAATVALLLALAALTAEIAASRQQAHRLHQAAAASETSGLLRAHPAVTADPIPDVVEGWRRHQQQVHQQHQQEPNHGRSATAQGAQRKPLQHPNPPRPAEPPRRGPRR